MPVKMTILTWKNNVLSSIFSQNRLMCTPLRCLTEAILTSELLLKENDKTKAIFNIGMFPHDELYVQCQMYSEKAFDCLSVDLVLTTVFLESVEDRLTNVFITETSPFKSYPRF